MYFEEAMASHKQRLEFHTVALDAVPRSFSRPVDKRESWLNLSHRFPDRSHLVICDENEVPFDSLGYEPKIVFVEAELSCRDRVRTIARPASFWTSLPVAGTGQPTWHGHARKALPCAVKQAE